MALGAVGASAHEAPFPPFVPNTGLRVQRGWVHFPGGLSLRWGGQSAGLGARQEASGPYSSWGAGLDGTDASAQDSFLWLPPPLPAAQFPSDLEFPHVVRSDEQKEGLGESSGSCRQEECGCTTMTEVMKEHESLFKEQDEATEDEQPRTATEDADLECRPGPAAGANLASKLQMHLEGRCRPCNFQVLKENGCRHGDACAYCHFCTKQDLQQRRRKREKVPRRKGGSGLGENT